MLQSSMSLLYRAAVISLLYCLSASVFYLLATTDYVPVHGLDGVRFAIFILLTPIIIKYVLQLLAAFGYALLKKHRQEPYSNLETPAVSVLIPAWNEEVGIIKTIQSVLNTRYNNLEVIVINDGSTDRTHQLVSEFIDAYNTPTTAGNDSDQPQKVSLKYLRLSNGGKAKALNCGLRLARGEFVITIDSDSVMDRAAIEQMICGFSDPQVAAVAGNVIVGNRKKPIELMQQLEYLYGFFFKRADSVFNAVYVIGGAAAAYRRDVLEKLGGFDENIITEDVEMSVRILGAGYQTRYAASAVIYTEGPSDWKGLFRQRLRWKYGRLLTYVKHKQLFFNCEKHLNPYLTCFMLPLAIYAEITLLLEGLLLTIFFGYTIYTNDYLPLALMIGLIASFISIQILFDSKSQFHRNLLLLAPVAWIIFYVVDVVELQALYRSLKRMVKREDLEWQRWVRVGLLNNALSPSREALDPE